jgi:threo-3-hydroxy-L-aspartate ammonia-lyase
MQTLCAPRLNDFLPHSPVQPPLVLPTFDDVLAAARRLLGHAHRTPVLTSGTADRALGAQLFFKCENFQRMGAFKFRGAFNAMARLDAAQRRAGVICFSSGNHAQAVALSGQLLGIRTTVLMPNNAPPLKIEATRGYLQQSPVAGGEVILYDRFKDDREAMMHRLAQERGLAMIPPFDHADVIAGAGTAALELIQDAGPLDALFVCTGGGGLLTGSALAAHALSPGCKIYGVEPQAGNDAQQSLRAGQLIRIATPQTIADGAQTQSIGQLNFALMRRDVADVLTVSDAQLMEAMRFFAERMKILVEPTGALGYAGACQAAAALRGQRVGIIVSGGNVDLQRFCSLLAGA